MVTTLKLLGHFKDLKKLAQMGWHCEDDMGSRKGGHARRAAAGCAVPTVCQSGLGERANADPVAPAFERPVEVGPDPAAEHGRVAAQGRVAAGVAEVR
jgi:hypothetical protein